MAFTPSTWARLNAPAAPQSLDTIIASATTEQPFATQPIIPSFLLSTPRAFRLVCDLVLSTPVASAGALTLKVYLGSTVIGTSSAITLTTGQTNSTLTLKSTFQIITPGSAGSSLINAQGSGFIFPVTAGVASAVLGYGMPNATGITSVDCTTSQTLKITATYSVAVGSSNSLTLAIPVLEYTV